MKHQHRIRMLAGGIACLLLLGVLNLLPLGVTAAEGGSQETGTGSDLSPVAYWSFEGVTGTAVVDASGNGNAGELLGKASIVTDKFGKAVRFSAAGDIVRIPVSEVLNFTETESYTVSLWVKPEALGGWQAVFNKGGKNENGNGEWIGLWFNNSTYHFGQKSGYTQNTTVATENGTWSQVVLVQDAAAGKSHIYVNGALASEKDWCVTAVSAEGSYLYLGANNKNGAEPFLGLVDEVKIYHRAMEEKEILDTYTLETKEETGDKEEETVGGEEETYAKWTGDFPALGTEETVGVILDTDISGDSDDLGALALLYYYAQKGRVEPLALISCVGGYSAPMMKAVSTYYGYPDVPVAARWQTPDSHSNYGKYITGHFETSVKDNRDTLSTTELYRKTLAAAEDGSVTVVSVGTLINLYDLLASSPDSYSSLTGAELVKKKVKILVSMGGSFPSGKETNIKNAAEAAQYVNKNWPTPIIYSGYEIGYSMTTATRLEEMGMWDNPVSAGYQVYFDYYAGGRQGRPSWDPLTVYFACAGYEEYYELCRGDMSIDAEGNNTFRENSETGARAYLKLRSGFTVSEVAEVLDQLMVDAVKGNTSRRRYLYADLNEENVTVTGFTKKTIEANSRGASLFDDSYYLATEAGAALSYTFIGTELLAYGELSPQGGRIAVYLDGKEIRTVDLYAKSRSVACLFSLDGLSFDAHTLTVVSLTEKNASSRGNEVMLDFFKVGLGDAKEDLSVRGNLTLAADLGYNFYLPKSAAVVGLTVDGEALTLSSLPTVMRNDGQLCYKVTLRFAPKDAAEERCLVILLSQNGEQSSATYLLSIPAYAARIVNGGNTFTDTTKTLMRDMLSYVDAAMTYFGTATTAKQEAIKAVLGESYALPSDSDVGLTADDAVSSDTASVIDTACLELGDIPAFVFYLKKGEESLADSFNFSMKGTPLKVEKRVENGRTYLVVTTYAYGMNDTLTFTYAGGSGSYNLAKYHQGTGESDTALRTLTVRLAKYARSADAYKAEPA